jgi:hypothetical protein
MVRTTGGLTLERQTDLNNKLMEKVGVKVSIKVFAGERVRVDGLPIVTGNNLVFLILRQKQPKLIIKPLKIYGATGLS